MKRSFHPSLGQTVTLAALGGLLMASTFPLMALAHLDHGHRTLAFWSVLYLSSVPMLLGLPLFLKAFAHIKDGIANGLWAPGEVASFRGSFETVLWRGLSLSLVLASCIILLAASRSRQPITWFLLVLGQTTMQLTFAFQTKPNLRPPSGDWSNGSPIHSDHWGNR
jgi:hypothetical protein